VFVTRSLGLDIGDSWIGVALSDPEGILASPLTIINRENDSAVLKAIIDIVRQNQVGQIIVGLPLSMDGSLGKQAEKVRAFVTELCYHTEVPVKFRDERLSTVEVKRMVQGVRKTNRKTRYDAMAAALILQGYLDEVR
jgi:putative Holliday junction resolvase